VAAGFAKGLRATTGAPVVEGVSGWVGFTCDAEEMAVWMIRALAAENITVRREGSTVFLPVSVSFAIEDEIIDMVVAAARAMHFFEDHIRVTDHEHE
jgi:sirohydrochlorin cobaltochelatase